MSEKSDNLNGAPAKPSEPNVSRETSEPPEQSTPPEKNKRSSFYVYLAILFGAAFLMLLLAYFVQQRNSDTALSDLRSTTAASRQELLEEIQRLEEENEALRQDKEMLNEQLKDELARNKELEKKSERYWEDYSRMTAWYNQSNLLDCLERCRDTGEWFLMGEILQMSDPLFNREHPDFSNQYLIPAQEARYLELREELFEKSGFMVMERRMEPDGTESAEFPLIREDAFREGIRKTATDLWAIVRDRAIDPEYAARLITEFTPNSGNMEILHSGVFQASTVEWFEEIKADLTAQGYLIENEDGTVSLCEKE